jgi:ABC-2 type transport system ATP-binding protein
MQDIVIKASKLTKSYNGFVAVGGISFEVPRGEIFGFLGPNGAGKTTTIRMLTGLAKPSSGKASIAGFDVLQDIQKVKENIGLVPETSNIYSEMTAWDNLMFSGEIYGVPKAKREKRAHELLKAFMLSHRRKAKVKKFSRGMKRRLTLSMALLHEPAILFLDEPTTGLDVQSARYIRHLVRDLKDKGVTVFLTTHYIEEADQLCDRIAIINKGKIIAYDTPEGLKKSVQKGHALEISFERAPEGLLNDLKAMSGIDSVDRFGDKFRVYSEDTSHALSSLIDHAGKKGLRIISLNTLRPSLEEAFIKITGLSYGAMEEEKGEGRGKVAAS